MELLRPLLPSRYSPLQPSGNGLQSVYLAPLPDMMAEALVALIGAEAVAVKQTASRADLTMTATNPDVEVWEHHIESELDRDTTIPNTDRQALITARRGQGIFKERVMVIERRCRVTGVENPTHLRARHCKPWRDSNNERVAAYTEYRPLVRPRLYQLSAGRWVDHLAGRPPTIVAAHGCAHGHGGERGRVHRAAGSVLGGSSRRGFAEIRSVGALVSPPSWAP
jgi:hypothetical protein